MLRSGLLTKKNNGVPKLVLYVLTWQARTGFGCKLVFLRNQRILKRCFLTITHTTITTPHKRYKGLSGPLSS